ncbi:interferon-induced GTP-binding protein Mx isoform X3 [Acanthopagrus latus]|uniref:interferon-induced GTP-binding protein Mx isoform X3 n=1 Tax=Acanthopagrus latus TaxID=8177 RepID=UPI00187BE0FC|nr:interferon-induced GTP-binding protein Mx isoform X3 [Acanthopagrus latus]
MNTLNQQYEERVRPCIDLIDSLRSLGVERDLALPAIAVIGDQSSGKSSVLEALSGVALPRGSGIVTRCPLELKMKRKKEGEKWHGRISYNDYMEELDDPAYVEESIREAQDEMAGVGSGISGDLISLEIASPDVPDLTLIDLPGIARVAVKGQPENIGEQIKRLIQSFITKQETISLVVVPSNVDIATTEALKMAQEVDPDGERTLGILTKPDLVDKGTEGTVVDIVHNEVIHLKKGYMIVKCRGQKEITEKVSLTEATEREEAFFKGHECFHVLYNEGHATVPKLAEKLTLELVHHIQMSLPRLEDQIEKKLAQIHAELVKYGDGLPSDAAERLVFLIDRVTAFTQDAISLAAGEELRSLKIFSMLRRVFAVWKGTIDQCGVKFNWNIEKQVAEYERKYRGRELPGFVNYKTFEGMVKEQIKQLEEPAVLKLKEVSEIVKEELFKMAERSFVGFPHLIRIAKVKIEAIRKEKEITAEALLRTQFRMESIVYTQDSAYSKKLGKRKREPEKVTSFFNDSVATLTEMTKHLKSYYQIAGRRLADQIPLVILYQLVQEFTVQLQREMLQVIQDKEKAESLLEEESGIRAKRVNLQNRQERLKKARALLMEFSMNMYSFSKTQLQC